MRKVKYFFISFLPLIITEVTVNALAILAVLILFICSISSSSGDFNSCISRFYDIVTSDDYNALIMICYTLIILPSFSIFYYLKLGGNIKPNFKKTFNIPLFLGIIFLVPAGYMMSDYICIGIQILKPTWWQSYLDLLETTGLGSNTLIMSIYGIIFAPICEELIFRGLTLRLAKISLPFWGANLLQAALFGFFHGNWTQGVYAFALGLLLGYVCDKGGSLYCSILLHMLFNTWGTFMPDLASLVTDQILYYVISLLTLTFFALIGFSLFNKGLEEKKKVKNLS